MHDVSHVDRSPVRLVVQVAAGQLLEAAERRLQPGAGLPERGEHLVAVRPAELGMAVSTERSVRIAVNGVRSSCPAAAAKSRAVCNAARSRDRPSRCRRASGPVHRPAPRPPAHRVRRPAAPACPSPATHRQRPVAQQPQRSYGRRCQQPSEPGGRGHRQQADQQHRATDVAHLCLDRLDRQPDRDGDVAPAHRPPSSGSDRDRPKSPPSRDRRTAEAAPAPPRPTTSSPPPSSPGTRRR